MLSLFKNKKAQLVDPIGGLQRAITWFLDSVPKPIKIILFLLFLLGFAAIFSFLLNSTGNFCDTAGNEYRTNPLQLITNLKLIGSMPNQEDLASGTIDAGKTTLTQGTLGECGVYFINPNNKTYYLNKTSFFNVETTILPENYYYLDDGCIICDESHKVRDEDDFLIRTTLCFDERIISKDYDDQTFLEKQRCNPILIGRCKVPKGYYWDKNTNNYVCENDLCNNETGGTIGELWNLKLLENGAKIRPPSEYGDKDYRNAITIECDAGDLKPKLRVFSIEVFNYQLWILLIVLSGLVWGVFKIKNH